MSTSVMRRTLLVVVALATLNSPAQVHKAAPDERFFPLVFTHILRLNEVEQRQAALTSSKLTRPAVSQFFVERAGMSLPEAEALLQEAEGWQKDVAPVDAKAFARIRELRSAAPGGRLAPGQAPPLVPQDLMDLQSLRDDLTLKHVAHLRSSLGESRFTEFSGHIRAISQARPASGSATPAKR